MVPNYSGGGDLKVSSKGTFIGIEICGLPRHQCTSKKNILGSLLQAEFICSSLGCHPMGSQIEFAGPLFVLARRCPMLVHLLKRLTSRHQLVPDA